MAILLMKDSVPDLLFAQQALGERLVRLGTYLQQRQAADPVLVMETAIAALALTRTELEDETVQAALSAAPREQVEWWEHELMADETYVAELLDAVRGTARGFPQLDSR